jgi:hypothetical protein
MEWVEFAGVFDVLVKHLFGDYLTLGIVLCCIFLIILVAQGFPFRYVVIIGLPVISAAFLINWMVSGALYVVLMIAGLTLAITLMVILRQE